MCLVTFAEPAEPSSPLPTSRGRSVIRTLELGLRVPSWCWCVVGLPVMGAMPHHDGDHACFLCGVWHIQEGWASCISAAPCPPASILVSWWPVGKQLPLHPPPWSHGLCSSTNWRLATGTVSMLPGRQGHGVVRAAGVSTPLLGPCKHALLACLQAWFRGGLVYVCVVCGVVLTGCGVLSAVLHDSL